METNFVYLVRTQAFEWHERQFYGQFPYCLHLMDVVRNLIEFGYIDEDLIAAAYLHDSIEDVEGVTMQTISDMFGDRVASLVHAVSGEGASRQEKKTCMIQRLTAFPDAVPVKMADRLANMRSSKLNKPNLFKKYVKEMSDYEQLFKNCNMTMYEEMLKLSTDVD